MAIDASQCVVIMERIAQAVRREDQKEVNGLILELINFCFSLFFITFPPDLISYLYIVYGFFNN
jgi:hypothetical protein